MEKTHVFQPIAVESLGPMNIAAYSFLAELGRKISDVSVDDRESSYQLQRICSNTALQRYLAARELDGGEPPGSLAIGVLTFFFL